MYKLKSWKSGNPFENAESLLFCDMPMLFFYCHYWVRNCPTRKHLRLHFVAKIMNEVDKISIEYAKKEKT